MATIVVKETKMADTAWDSESKTWKKLIRGKVKRTIPMSGYFWIAGEDGTDYFGHQTLVQDGVKIDDMWVGQVCAFIPKVGTKGPYADHILMDVPASRR